jgi:hypothetical protein
MGARSDEEFSRYGKGKIFEYPSFGHLGPQGHPMTLTLTPIDAAWPTSY